MKNSLSISAIGLFFSFWTTCLFSQSPPAPFVVDINQAWVAKNYILLAEKIDIELQANPDNIVALYASYNFNLMIKPNLPKLQAAAAGIKTIADSANKPLITEVSAEIQTNIAAIIQEGVRPVPQALLDRLHASSPLQFPLINIGLKMETALQN